MPRIPRNLIKSKEEVAFYHIISHTVWEAKRPFSSFEKEFFLRLLRTLAGIYLVDVISYAILDNHFHLLVRVLPGNYLTEEEAVERALKFYSPGIVFLKDANYWKNKLSDISSFMKDLKQRFTQWYNRIHGRKGHLWNDRFKSVRIEEGKALMAVAAYIDLNPVRAGMTRRIDGWKYTSYSARRAFSGKWLVNIEDIFEGLSLKKYGELLEEVGNMEKNDAGKVEERQKPLIFHIINYRATGIAFGGREFILRIVKGIAGQKHFKDSSLLFIT